MLNVLACHIRVRPDIHNTTREHGRQHCDLLWAFLFSGHLCVIRWCRRRASRHALGVFTITHTHTLSLTSLHPLAPLRSSVHACDDRSCHAQHGQRDGAPHVLAPNHDGARLRPRPRHAHPLSVPCLLPWCLPPPPPSPSALRASPTPAIPALCPSALAPPTLPLSPFHPCLLVRRYTNKE